MAIRESTTSRHKQATAIGADPNRPGQRTDNLRLAVFRSLDSLRPIADAWDELAEEAAQRLHTLSYSWISSYVHRLLADDESWAVVAAFDGTDLAGVLPVVIRERRRLGVPCTDLCTPHSPDTVGVDLLLRPNDVPAVARFMLTGLAQHFPNWFELRLMKVTELSPLLALARSGILPCTCYHDTSSRAAVLDTTGDFDAFMHTLHKSFARNLRRLDRKIDTLPDVEAHFITGDDAAEEYLTTFEALEASGWKSRSGSSLIQNAPLRHFYEDLTARLHERESLEWHILKSGGEAIAIVMAIRTGRSLILQKIAFDERFASYSPGNVLMHKTIKRAFEDPDIDEMNCLTEMAWNHNWNMDCRSYHDLILWPRRTLPFIMRRGPMKLRSVVRDWPGARAVYHGLQRLVGIEPDESDARFSPREHEH